MFDLKTLTHDQPLVMGILNVTSDSFSDGGQFNHLDSALAQARRLIAEGADILDIGGESTRPGAETVNIADELNRTIPVITAIREFSNIAISIDTRKPEVAEAAMVAGADIWNDVSALTYSPDSPETAARLDVPVILMHAQGTPKDMQDNPYYDDVVAEVHDGLRALADIAIAAGVKREHIFLDPGIGFGKRLEDNLALMSRLDDFHDMGYPLLLGASRKSFIKALDGSEADQRLGGSIAAALWGAAMQAKILRVHDVHETVQALKVWAAIKENNQ